MVRRTIAFALALGLLVGALGFAAAFADEEPTINETYEITVNEVGDASVVDTIKYSEEDYKIIKKVNEKKRTFLTRRYTTEDSTGEMTDFKTKTSDSGNSVVITYVKPGLAYHTKGEFVLYGYPEKPESESGGKFTFEETSTVNSEFTLFEDQVFKTTSIVNLPAEASNARYDAQDMAIKYEMPPAKTLYGFLSEQKTVMSALFGVLFLLFAVLLAFVWRRPAAEPAHAVTGDTARAPGHNFCESCGAKTEAGKKFCEGCGARLQ